MRSLGCMAILAEGRRRFVSVNKRKVRLGDILVQEAYVTPEQLNECTLIQRQTGKCLGGILVDKGYLTEEDLVVVLSEQLGIPHVRIANYTIPKELLREVPEALARQYQMLPVSVSGGMLTLAMSDPLNIMAIDDLRMITSRDIGVVVAAISELAAAIDSHYGAGGVDDMLHTLIGDLPPVKAGPSEGDYTARGESHGPGVSSGGERRDGVHFSVTVPAYVPPDSFFVVDVWAHLDAQRGEVARRAREMDEGGGIRMQSKGPFELDRGVTVSVELVIDGLVVAEPRDSLLWTGEIANASFPVAVTGEVPPGKKAGRVVLRVDGIQIGRLHFTVSVLNGISTASPSIGHSVAQKPASAFASYASEDRDEVLARVQGIGKVAPHLSMFLDVHSLRSGANWEKELFQTIPTHDIFYLFWSDHAKDSPWVEREWRCALETKGLDFIDPVPLVSPDRVPPPAELASRHFNDWVLAYMSASNRRA